MNNLISKAKSSVTCKELGNGEYVMYDKDKDKLHIINETAFSVWRFCDGCHTADSIEEKLRDEYKITNSHNITMDIKKILDLFDKEELLNEC